MLSKREREIDGWCSVESAPSAPTDSVPVSDSGYTYIQSKVCWVCACNNMIRWKFIIEKVDRSMSIINIITMPYRGGDG